MEIPEPRRDTRFPLNLDLGLYFLSPLGIAIDLGKPKLYDLNLERAKFISTHPVAMPMRGRERINFLSLLPASLTSVM
jgi:hypothetical protein